jgi:hypothetical protein
MNQSSPSNSATLEKLIVAYEAKKFRAFYGRRRFITVLPGTCHRTLFGARWIQFTVIILISVLVLNLRLRLPIRLLLSGFPTKTFYPFIFCSVHATFSAHPLLLIYNNHPHYNPRISVDTLQECSFILMYPETLLLAYICLSFAVMRVKLRNVV